MKRQVRWSAGLIAAVTAISLGAAVTVAQDKEAIVKERQAMMKQQSDDLKAIKGFLDGSAGDQATAVAKAQDLIAIADKLPTLWPAGTSSKDLPGKSNAKPDIWEQMDKFKAIPAALKGAEQMLLEALQKGDKAAAGTALGDAGKNGCGACHGAFREKMS